jgi:hypothetical protein
MGRFMRRGGPGPRPSLGASRWVVAIALLREIAGRSSAALVVHHAQQWKQLWLDRHPPRLSRLRRLPGARVSIHAGVNVRHPALEVDALPSKGVHLAGSRMEVCRDRDMRRHASGTSSQETSAVSSLGHKYDLAFCAPTSGPGTPSAGLSSRTRRSTRFALQASQNMARWVLQTFTAVFYANGRRLPPSV